MATPDDPRNTDWRTESRFYRTRPGLGWLLALLLVPLLLAALSLGLRGSDGDSDVAAPTESGTAPAQTSGAADSEASAGTAPLAFTRSANTVTVTGEVPTDAAKTELLDTVKGQFGSAVSVVDDVTVRDGVPAPDTAKLGAALKAGADIKDFSYTFSGDTATLRGTAPSDAVKAAVATSVTSGWPQLKVDNQIQVAAGSAAGTCPPAQGDIDGALTQNPVTFATSGFALTDGARQTLTAIAAKIKACPAAKVAVKGYTDSSGTDAINVPLSDNRAKAVADFLRSQGIPAANVSGQGFGAASPIASNDSPDGRAQNRRVEITVS